MSSKLNPNAGAFVPSFVVPVEVVTAAMVTTPAAPSPGVSKKNKGNITPTNAVVNLPKSTRSNKVPVDAVPHLAVPIETPLPAVRTLAELAEAGRIVRGRQHYSIAELLQFRPFFTDAPPGFDFVTINAMCGGTVKEKTKLAAKREKQRAAAAASQPVLHYDPNAYAYFRTTSPDLDNKAKQPRHKPTDSPEDEMKDAIAKLNRLLDNLPPANLISVDETINSFHDIPVTCTLSLQAVVGVLFDRAIAAPELSQFYAPFCSGLSDSLPDFKDGARTINFRRILLTKCYEALVEEADHASWRRQSMLGNVGLIGELFRRCVVPTNWPCGAIMLSWFRQLLTENIMHVCVAMMLDADLESVHPAPQVLQAACQLLLQVGDLLDGSSPASRRTMDEYFDALQRLTCHNHLESSLSQLIHETLEARSSGWIRKRIDVVDVQSPAMQSV
ncbi:hypothetical protein, variant 1 [Aphanomyces invadans]|uniref:MIF4G domain-containing protein n=1 Tax=Aphanomyces invadans TaxID=157072 RepID=A0A024UEI3_9STRA|nr:hypothetical protein, variant 1 [Aphanomyces invadans]ETW04292.1 hypothetical protein, variant 1 [Aphanomyces invadans]|eukprot:XP_008867248.1 hypothetical protein, variant 1 [Aphanomyces invadans]